MVASVSFAVMCRRSWSWDHVWAIVSPSEETAPQPELDASVHNMRDALGFLNGELKDMDSMSVQGLKAARKLGVIRWICCDWLDRGALRARCWCSGTPFGIS